MKDPGVFDVFFEYSPAKAITLGDLVGVFECLRQKTHQTLASSCAVKHELQMFCSGKTSLPQNSLRSPDASMHACF